ncbi:hypothetical protein GIB67_015809 [Kingdonia uniflora]|uniref:Uncharacterized protein n=1 Tax=Kingdonia uniflora TaxID=39325 RepID=A0A7J7NUI2_9MAGN|nr:hypothetical protein GIB67_015809 [Kingdonia uniflora]
MIMKTLPFESFDVSRWKPHPSGICCCSSRNHSFVRKLEPFNTSRIKRGVKEPSIIEKTEHQLADYCSTLEGDDSYKCWRAYFEFKDLEVLTSISSSPGCQGSMEELDAALLELRANPCFPQNASKQANGGHQEGMNADNRPQAVGNGERSTDTNAEELAHVADPTLVQNLDDDDDDVSTNVSGLLGKRWPQCDEVK